MSENSRIDKIIDLLSKKSGDSQQIGVIPIENCNGLLDWMVKTIQYIPRYRISRDVGREVVDVISAVPPSAEEWKFVLDKEQSFVLKTLFLVVPEYDEKALEDYLLVDDTKNVSLAFAIVFGQIDMVLAHGSDDALVLFCENNDIAAESLGDNEINRLGSALVSRLEDNNKVMYTRLVNNLYLLLPSRPMFITPKLIANYIAHSAGVYGVEDRFLCFLLGNSLAKHPDFTRIAELGWDPYFKSRLYGKWLRAVKRMECLIHCYSALDSNQLKFSKKNWEYLRSFQKFKQTYSVCF